MQRQLSPLLLLIPCQCQLERIAPSSTQMHHTIPYAKCEICKKGSKEERKEERRFLYLVIDANRWQCTNREVSSHLTYLPSYAWLCSSQVRSPYLPSSTIPAPLLTVLHNIFLQLLWTKGKSSMLKTET